MVLFSDITFWMVFIFFLAIYAFIRRYSRMGMVLYVAAFSLLFFYLANGWLMVLLPTVALVAWWAGRLLATMQRESGGAVVGYRRPEGLDEKILIVDEPYDLNQRKVLCIRSTKEGKEFQSKLLEEVRKNLKDFEIESD